MNSLHRSAYNSYAELSAMIQKRNKSGVLDDILIGQVPIDSRRKFDARLDVDPYPRRSAYAFLDVHAKYKFRNSPDGYNYTRDSFKRFLYYNRTDYTESFGIAYNPDSNTEFEFVLVLIAVKAYTCKVERVKESKNGSYNFLLRYIDADVEVSGVFIGRDWTLAVIN
ncbi:35618_t:CDS:2 [Gigaspora margarita]|uniref:35618_t:CDS:1 n=1 Tax=Gigaspora margarita TaxID=4874 RepID=A0ABN7VLQ1_GIGMA|nr:35618_t:CDS:2 [Gigaspora margarita]